MQWADFLANEAAIHSLSPEQTVAFVERLKAENSGKSEAKLASELNIGAAAFKKRMTEVYDMKRNYKNCTSYYKHLGKLQLSLWQVWVE